MLKKLFVGFVVFGVTCSTFANEDKIKQAMQPILHEKIESINKTPYSGLYEIRTDTRLLYTDPDAQYIFVGNVFDAKSGKNLSLALNFSELPLDLAVKTVKGNGKHVIATFEDPNCGYCRKLAGELAKIDNITVYTFLYPILSSDSADKTRKIWCAKDRSKAWMDWIGKGVALPALDAKCQAPVQQLLQLGRKLHVDGTPTIVFIDGDRVPGYMTANKLEERLNRLAKQ